MAACVNMKERLVGASATMAGSAVGDSTPTADQFPIGDIDLEASHIQIDHDGARLIGSRCDLCSAACFPKREVCYACGGRAMSVELLPATGSLYSYSTVHVSSSRPTPYTIGYVDLDGGVRLLANIEGSTSQLAPDMRVSLHALETGFAFAGVEKTHD